MVGAFFTFVTTAYAHTQVTFQTAKDMQEFQMAALPESERWICKAIKVDESRTVDFWYRDMQACIIQLYKSTKHGDGFYYESDADAKSEPHGTRVWIEEETAVRAEVGNDSYIAGVQLYADATAVTLKGRSVHPVYMCLLNHPNKKKIQNIVTVAYLPHLEFVEGTDQEEGFRLLKLSLYHKSFDVLFSSLRRMRDAGVLVPGIDGHPRRVVGVLLNFIGDNPEVW